MIQRGQSSDFICKPVLVLIHCDLRTNSSILKLQLFNLLGLPIAIPGYQPWQRARFPCLLTWFILGFRSSHGPAVPALWSLPQREEHPPLPVPGGVHGQLLRGAAGWVWLQPLPERSHLPGSPGRIPVRGNPRERDKNWGHCDTEESGEIRNTWKL